MIADPQLNPAAIELGTFFPQPPTTIWRALTDPDLLEQWLFRPTGFTPTPGTHFQFTTPAAPINEVTCEVLTAHPYKQLTYTWLYPHSDHPTRWIVDWNLQPQGHGTRLLLTQTGFDTKDRRQKMLRNAMERGWKRTALPRLSEVIHHGWAAP
ncbi:SRPBCC family protein [Nocardia sp. CA-128927]|uniref:SRPBCC family protein n=1 Tax=Nocardia sp. CA-128927 TaxID=3239975 RepID=UPI003D998421